MTNSNIICVDGEFLPEAEAKVSVFDHGVLYGDGVFEGIRAYDGTVFALEEHITRLYDSAKGIALTIPLSAAEMTQQVLEVLKRNQLQSGYIRLVVTRGAGNLGLDPNRCKKASYFIIAQKLLLYPESLYENGVKLITSSVRRAPNDVLSPQIKSLNYLNNITAKIEANNAGADEALMLNCQGMVAECSSENVFVLKNSVLKTPPLSAGALDGITRKFVMQLAIKRGIETIECDLTKQDIYAADECFLTGTGAELVPVAVLDQRLIGTSDRKVFKQLLADFRAFTKIHGTKI